MTDAHAAADGDGPGGEVEGFGDDDRETVREALGRRRAHVVGHDDREFITTQPEGRISLAYRSAEAFADLAQDIIACAMAKGVVDLFEPVEVDREEREGILFPASVIERVLHRFFEVAPVAQFGQFVRHGLAFE